MAHLSRHPRLTRSLGVGLVVGWMGCLAPSLPPSTDCFTGIGLPPLPVDASGVVGCRVVLRRNVVASLSSLAGVTSARSLYLDDLPWLDAVRLPAKLRVLDDLHLVDSVAGTVDLGETLVDHVWIQRSAVQRVTGLQRQLRALVIQDARALNAFDFPRLEELGELVLVDTDSLHVLAGFPALRRLGRLVIVDAEALEAIALPTEVRVDRLEFWLNPRFDATTRTDWMADQRTRAPEMAVMACGGPGLVACVPDREPR